MMLVISSFQEWHFEIHHNLPGEVREESLELPRWSPAEMPNIGTGGTCRILHTKVTINTHTHTCFLSCSHTPSSAESRSRSSWKSWCPERQILLGSLGLGEAPVFEGVLDRP